MIQGIVMTKARRNKLEIYIEILDIARQPTGPTRIMFGCNMSWNPIKKRINELIELKLLRAIPTTGDRKEYVTTDIGIEALNVINNPLLEERQ